MNLLLVKKTILCFDIKKTKKMYCIRSNALCKSIEYRHHQGAKYLYQIFLQYSIGKLHATRY